MQLIAAQVDPRPIAVARIGLGVITVMNSLESFLLLNQIARGKLAFPVHKFLPDPSVLGVNLYLVGAIVAGSAITLGWHTSVAAAFSTALSVGVLLTDQQTYSSHLLLATLLVAYLIFARSDSAWSFSRSKSFVPWWPQLLMMTQIAVCYFFSAFSKLTLTFLSGAPLSLWVWAPLPWWMFFLMASGAVLIELFLAVGLWFRRTRCWAAALGLILHLSIVLLMKEQTLPLIAFALTCLSQYGLFIFRPSFQFFSKPETAGVPSR